MNLCGHATIATVHTLMVKGIIKTPSTAKQETKAGILEVECREDGLVTMTQAEPSFLDYQVDKKHIANLLGLEIEKITDWPIKIVSTGTPKLIIPIAKLDDILKIKPDLEGIKQFCIESGARGFYPFSRETQSDDTDFHTRQFNPLAGVNEDPATGVAAGALAAYIKKLNLLPNRKFTIEQGYVMGKPSRIFVDVTNHVRVGGYAVTVGSKKLEIDS